jgi:hypothetical protein
MKKLELLAGAAGTAVAAILVSSPRILASDPGPVLAVVSHAVKNYAVW